MNNYTSNQDNKRELPDFFSSTLVTGFKIFKSAEGVVFVRH